MTDAIYFHLGDEILFPVPEIFVQQLLHGFTLRRVLLCRAAGAIEQRLFEVVRHVTGVLVLLLESVFHCIEQNGIDCWASVRHGTLHLCNHVTHVLQHWMITCWILFAEHFKGVGQQVVALGVLLCAQLVHAEVPLNECHVKVVVSERGLFDLQCCHLRLLLAPHRNWNTAATHTVLHGLIFLLRGVVVQSHVMQYCRMRHVLLTCHSISVIANY